MLGPLSLGSAIAMGQWSDQWGRVKGAAYGYGCMTWPGFRPFLPHVNGLYRGLVLCLRLRNSWKGVRVGLGLKFRTSTDG